MSEKTTSTKKGTTENTEGKTRKYNVQNLVPYGVKKDVLSHDEAKERGRIGGIKSGESRRKRKTMKENILAMLSQEVTPEKLEAMGVDISTLNGDYTMQNAIISAMLREAIGGDTKAMQLLRDTIDEAPTTRQEVTQEIITKEDVDMIESVRKNLLTS